MNDFWISCGHHLLDRDEGGGLLVTDDFLKVYLARPELIPPPEACAVERTLHGALLADPRMPVSASDIAAIADADARENWQMLIAFRDHLVRHKTLEAAYAELVKQGLKNTPQLFVNQLVHVVMRNALDGVEDAKSWCAPARMFYRTQRVTMHEGSLIAADEENIGGANPASVSPLVSMLGIPAEAHIHVINGDNADSYWERSDQFDMAIDLTGGRDGLVALATAMQRWIAHVLGVDVTIEPLTEMREVNLAWYVGLDADATKIGDLLWNGEDLDEATMAQVIGLFRLDVPRSVGRARQGQGRAGLSDPGDDAGQADPHEAAEPGHRSADPPSGGRQLSTPPLATIPVGVLVERSKSMNQWAEFYWRAVGVLAGQPETPAWTKLSDDGERATFYAGTAECRIVPHRDRFLSRQSRIRRAVAMGRAARGRRRAAIHGRGGDRRSGGRRKLHRNGDRSGRAGADAGGDPADVVAAFVSPSTMSSSRSSSASATAPIRKPWRGGRLRRRSRMSEPENFLTRWSRRKRVAEEPEQPAPPAGGERLRRQRRTTPQNRAASRPRPRPNPSRPSIRRACRRSIRLARKPTSAPS